MVAYCVHIHRLEVNTPELQTSVLSGTGRVCFISCSVLNATSMSGREGVG